MVKIVIDMMGGDNGYQVTMEAVKNFLASHDDCEIIAVGDEKVLEPIKDIVKIIPSQSSSKTGNKPAAPRRIRGAACICRIFAEYWSCI